MHLAQFHAHLRAKLCVEVGQRLIKKEHIGLAHHGAPHGNALALAARKLRWFAVQIRLQLKDMGNLGHLGVDILFAPLAHLEREAHVFTHGHVGIQSVVLENHGHVSIFGRFLIDHPVTDDDLATADLFQPCHHTQNRRFAAPGRTDQHDEFIILNLQVDAVDHFHGTIPFDHFLQLNIRHCSTLVASFSLTCSRSGIRLHDDTFPRAAV